jgi:hypothetical protein
MVQGWVPPPLDYLNFLAPKKLQCRVKTVLQLKITDLENPEKNVLILVLGAMHAKKLSQLVAYLTGHMSDFQYHPKKGSNLKGSHIESTYGRRRQDVVGRKECRQEGDRCLSESRHPQACQGCATLSGFDHGDRHGDCL